MDRFHFCKKKIIWTSLRLAKWREEGEYWGTIALFWEMQRVWVNVWGDTVWCPRWAVPRLEWELDPNVGAANPGSLVFSVPFGTGHEGASWPACFLFSFSPSLPVHSSPPAICSRFSWHCSWRVQYFFWPTEGEGRCLRVRQNLTCALLGFVIHNIQTKTWNLSALNFGLGQIFLWLCSLHLPLLSNTQSPLVAQKPGTFYSPGSDS